MRTQQVSRREAVKLGLAGLAVSGSGMLATDAPAAEAHEPASPPLPHPFLTRAGDFGDVLRGYPKPFTLQGDALAAARLTPQSWRLEITADATLADPVKQTATIARALTLADGMGSTFRRC